MDYEIMIINEDGTVGECTRVPEFYSTRSEVGDCDIAIGYAIRKMLRHWDVDSLKAHIEVRLVPHMDLG